jgi:hypothetical protein
VGVEDLAARVDSLTADGHFSGVIRVDRAGATVLERAAGWAHRAHQVPMTVDTRLAIASGSKGFTALVALSLAADGTLPLTGPGVMLEGHDAGVSFRTAHDSDSDTTHTVIANWSNGAWPVTRALTRCSSDGEARHPTGSLQWLH